MSNLRGFTTDYIILLASALLIIVFQPVSVHAAPYIKVGVYNIHEGIGTDGQYDLPRIARVLKSVSADIIGLNEVNRSWFGEGQDAIIAWELGPEWQAVFGKTINKPLRDYGNAILTRLPIVSSESWLLKEFPGQERRGLLRVTVRVGNEPVHFFCTHMGLNATMREENAREILEIIDGFKDGYRVIVGDFNEPRSGAGVELFAEKYKDCWGMYGLGGSGNTYSSTNPMRRIDFVWLDKRLAAASCYVAMHPDARVASDHMPMFANVLSTDTEAPVVYDISALVNGVERLHAVDVVSSASTVVAQGSNSRTTNSRAGTRAADDNAVASTLEPVYAENFNSTKPSGMPKDWAFLDAAKDMDYSGGVAVVGDEGYWRQRSENFVKYHYSPQDYPRWENYEVSARIKTISTGGGGWRLHAYHNDDADKGDGTYYIEVHHNKGSLPIMHLKKGATQLGEAVLPDYDVDPYDWNVYGLQVREVRLSDGARANRVVVRVNGRMFAAATDVPTAGAKAEAYTKGGSLMISTIGAADGWCEIFVDDVCVQQWMPVNPGDASRADEWSGISIRSDWKSAGSTGGWTLGDGRVDDIVDVPYRLKIFNVSGDVQLGLFKRDVVLESTSFLSAGLDVSERQNYGISIHRFQAKDRIIEKKPDSSMGSWLNFW